MDLIDFENAWNQQEESKRLFPLYAQLKYFPLPDELMNTRDAKNLPLFSRLKPQIFLATTFLGNYDLEGINRYVNFQYKKTYDNSDFTIETWDGKRDFSDYSSGLIVEVPVEFPNQDEREQDIFLQKSLNLLFSLSPTAQVTLLRIPLNKDFKQGYIDFRNSLLAFQTKYPHGICISDKNFGSEEDPSGTLFYQRVLEGKFFNLRDITQDDDITSCTILPPTDEEKELFQIKVEMFFPCGDSNWIQNNRVESMIIGDTFFPFCFTKNFICFVGGMQIGPENEVICYSDTSSGFYTSQCPELDPPEYIKQYGIKLPDDYKDKIRIPHVSHYAGPFWFPKNRDNSVDLSTLFLGVQYALMKTFYGENLITQGDGNFLEKMFDAERSSVDDPDKKLFTYVLKGTINPPLNQPDNESEFRNCEYDRYIIEQEGVNFWGLNPCGLGVPRWKSKGWLKTIEIENEIVLKPLIAENKQSEGGGAA